MPKIQQNGVSARDILASRFNPLETFMASKEKTGHDGELSEQQLDKVAGGMIKLGPTKPIFPPSTGPTFPTGPVIFNRS